MVGQKVEISVLILKKSLSNQDYKVVLSRTLITKLNFTIYKAKHIYINCSHYDIDCIY